LDRLMKIIVIALTISTLTAIFIAYHNNNQEFALTQIFPENTADIAFLIAFMGWMPAPLDVSVWQSLWCMEKTRKQKNIHLRLLYLILMLVTSVPFLLE